MAIEYTDKVIQHFTHPKNVGEIENPDGEAMEGSPACGVFVGGRYSSFFDSFFFLFLLIIPFKTRIAITAITKKTTIIIP